MAESVALAVAGAALGVAIGHLAAASIGRWLPAAAPLAGAAWRFSGYEGVVVDTHVGRVSKRLGLTRQTDPVKVEQDLMKLFPNDRWTMLSHLLIEHGRRICEARRPKCESCFLSDICPSSTV